MINFFSFSDELIKIAESAGTIPVFSKLPNDADRALEAIKRKVRTSKVSVLGHKTVAVPRKAFGDIASKGFEKTRLAVPLPGERIGTPSWRRGQLHAHSKDDYYLFHEDEHAPQKGFTSAIRHAIKEGIPASKKRFRDRTALVMG